MMGPARKPIPFRKAEGNLSKSKLHEEIQLKPGVPPRPEHLEGLSAWCWDHLIPILSAAKVLTLGDLTAVELGCMAYQDFRVAREVVYRLGMSYESVHADEEGRERRIIRPRAEVAIMSDAWKRYKSFLQEYGLTAAARARVSPIHNLANDEESDFA